MLNTELDAVVARVDQRRTFSPGRVVGANKTTSASSSSFSVSSSSSSSSSSSPLGMLWGPHRESPSSKRFAAGASSDQESDEANLFDEAGSGATATTEYNGFSGRYGNGTNLFAANFYGAYNTPPPADEVPDVDNMAGNLDLDLTHLDLGPDFDDHDDSRISTSASLQYSYNSYTSTQQTSAHLTSNLDNTSYSLSTPTSSFTPTFVAPIPTTYTPMGRNLVRNQKGGRPPSTNY
jgi:hypothetical protein